MSNIVCIKKIIGGSKSLWNTPYTTRNTAQYNTGNQYRCIKGSGQNNHMPIQKHSAHYIPQSILIAVQARE